MHLSRAKNIFETGPSTKRKDSATGPLNKTKPYATGPLSKTKGILKKMFSYHSKMHLFFNRPISQTQRFRYRSIKQNKAFCYRMLPAH